MRSRGCDGSKCIDENSPCITASASFCTHGKSSIDSTALVIGFGATSSSATTTNRLSQETFSTVTQRDDREVQWRIGIYADSDTAGISTGSTLTGFIGCSTKCIFRLTFCVTGAARRTTSSATTTN